MECKKVTFLTKEEATKRIAEIKVEKSKSKKPVRCYKCTKCGKFHLTSWNIKKKKGIAIKIIEREIDKKEAESEYWKKKNGW